jgi:ABC-type nitrate/sulfonate/bicarbonate transport system permease component
MTRRLAGVLAMGVVVLLWWLATAGGPEERFISPIILPSPLEVIRSFPSLLNDRALLQSISATLKASSPDRFESWKRRRSRSRCSAGTFRSPR